MKRARLDRATSQEAVEGILEEGDVPSLQTIWAEMVVARRRDRRVRNNISCLIEETPKSLTGVFVMIYIYTCGWTRENVHVNRSRVGRKKERQHDKVPPPAASYETCLFESASQVVAVANMRLCES